MGKINVLGFDIANLIAAGEVVDRPASVVKELLENAIDAGAKNITVEIRSGGVSRIRVTDDGSGIEYDDLPLTILRHATSKISAASDLAQIFTLGFRGEALAATAAVSKLTIVSKTKDAPLGARLVSEAGEILSLEETGCADGTTVIVDELFANVPARRKFLKKDSTETAAVTGVVEKIALSAPHISIRYVADGECKFQTPGNGDLKGVIYVLFGRDIAGRVRYIEREDGGIRVSGYISEPDFFRPNRNMQNFFINHRYVKSRTMAAAVEQAYNTRIPPDKFPFCVLNLELTPEAVDVNVHPAKLEVKFTNERIIFEAVYYAVLSELEKSGSMPQLEVCSRAARKLENDDGSAAKTGNRSFWVSGADARNLTGAFAPDKKSTKGEQLRVTENTRLRYSLKTSRCKIRGGLRMPVPNVKPCRPRRMQDTGRRSYPGRRYPTEQKSETLFSRRGRVKACSTRFLPPIIQERFIIHPRLTPPLSALPIHPKACRIHRSRTLHRTAKKPPNALKLRQAIFRRSRTLSPLPRKSLPMNRIRRKNAPIPPRMSAFPTTLFSGKRITAT